ncbi:DsbA family protein [Hyphomicrobium methylovorum]|uniref:DsbA family protein n=1 Tax=Hyphomicrobium methylovorum TaxID=84 RepID=UPI0015E72E13|nr:DsbA family protein [Hyphomicrobium methylovorum]
MHSSSFKRLLAGILGAGLLGLSCSAIADPAPTDRSELDSHIREYLMANPQVIRDALLKLEADEQTANTKRILRDLKGDIYSAGSPEIGATDAKVIIVEFYDYNCPYCRAAYPKIKDYLKANPDTKLVLKDIASLGKDSEAVSRIVIAATKQGKFETLHDALMTQKGQMTEARAVEIATKLGLDIEKLKKDARTPETSDALSRAQQLADRLNVPSTPLYIIGHNGISGSPEELIAQITQHANEIRKAGCDVC